MDETGKNRELIEHIADKLRNHAEPYREGAWERFSARSAGRPRKRLAWLGWAAAAVVLLAAGLFWFTGPQRDMRIARQAPAASPVVSGVQAPEVNTPEPQAIPPSVVVEQHRPDVRGDSEAGTVPLPLTARKWQAPVEPERGNTSALQPVLARVAATADTQQVAAVPEMQQRVAETATDTSAETLVTASTETKPEPPAESEHRSSVEQLLALEPGRSDYIGTVRNDDREAADKWDLGIVVAPSMTSERLNMGGGFAVAYRVSNKISLASGVSLNDLGVAQQQVGRPHVPQMSLDSPMPGHEPGIQEPYRSREVTSVTSTLLAIDVPLNLRYHVTEGFYTAVGVSFLGILNERRTNHFVDHMNQPTDQSGNLKAVHSAERSNEQPLQGKGYAGFVNFSIGRSIPISSKLSISLEPYFKLPVGRLSREDMDLTNGGIRIVTGF